MSNSNSQGKGRAAMRSALLSNIAPPRKTVELFGEEVEVRAPTFARIMGNRSDEMSPAEQAARMIVLYCFVPGTEESLFEEGDIPVIMEWPFSGDVVKLQQAISSLTELDPDEAAKELEADPT